MKEVTLKQSTAKQWKYNYYIVQNKYVMKGCTTTNVKISIRHGRISGLQGTDKGERKIWCDFKMIKLSRAVLTQFVFVY